MTDVLMVETVTTGPGRSLRPSMTEPRFAVIRQKHPLRPGLRELREAFAAAHVGERVAFAVPLDTPPAERLMTLIMFRWQRYRAESVMRRAGGTVLSRIGVDPSLDRPAYFCELGTAASAYADQYIRPRGSNVALRRLAAWCFGCDPAMGGVLIVGRKLC
jgi:hypothetical protein